MHDQDMSVGVIVATYNRAADYLATSLASIVAQTRPPDEIIVVDDGSTDETADVVAGFGPRVRYLYQANQGRPTALNTAIAVAESDYLLLFDDDDVLLPDAIELHLETLAHDPRAEYSYSRHFVFDDIAGGGDIWDRRRWRCGDVEAREPEQLLVGTMEWIGGMLSSMLIARRCFEQVGTFSEALLRAQDYEFQVRLARACRGRFVDRETFVSRVHEGARGPAHQRIAGAARYAQSHRYEQLIFRQLRREMPLAEYLPRDPHQAVPEAITPGQRTAALVTRCRIMFARGLFVEAAEDIAALLAHGRASAALIASLDEIVMGASNIGEPDYHDKALGFARALCRACRAPGDRPLLDSAARGFYWTALRARRQGNWRALPNVAAALALVTARRLQLARA